MHFYDIKTYEVYLIWVYKLKVITFLSVGVFSEIPRDLSVMETVTGRAPVQKTEARGSGVKLQARRAFLTARVSSPGG